MCGYFCIRFIDFMLKGKNLADFTCLFLPKNLKKKMMIKFYTILKMAEYNSIETLHIYPNINDQQQFRLKLF